MVSKARLLFPLPDRPVMTISRSRGISTSRFLRLCSRAPRTTIRSVGIGPMISDRSERLFASSLADLPVVGAHHERVLAANEPIGHATVCSGIVEMAGEDELLEWQVGSPRLCSWREGLAVRRGQPQAILQQYGLRA